MDSKSIKKIIFSTGFISVALLGVTYSKWVDRQTVYGSLTTGSMDYRFGYGSLIQNGIDTSIGADIYVTDKMLSVTIHDGSSIYGISDEFQIYYTLLSNYDNEDTIPMIKSGEIGDVSFTLNQNSVSCEMNGKIYQGANIANLLPSSLGTFKVNHDFNGSYGIIGFIPTSLPDDKKTSLDVSELPEGLQADWKKEDEGGNPITEGNIIVKGDYQFYIPLDFDQFNAK